ncbi:MAG: flagellar hook-associated protein FlgK [Fimbriimonadales bacterium]|nr:flagellar hook-associated protein FlgK [Fimbriimonadales bacterium]
MAGSFFGINIASRALRSFETALNVTGHNLANVNTRGYSRQIVEFDQTAPLTYFGLRPFTVGTGAFISSVNRARDMFVEGRIIQTQSEQSRLGQMLTSLRGIEMVFGEPSSDGISGNLSAMFDSWARLAANPADDAARLDVRSRSMLLVGRIREIDAQLGAEQVRLDAEIRATIDQVNQLGTKIKELNDSIRAQRAIGSTPNDLLDLRDRAIQELAAIVDIRKQELPDGTMTIFINQHTLVDQVAARPLPTEYDAATSTIQLPNKDIQIKGGKLAGLMAGINSANNYRAQLDTFVNELRTAVNALHFTGTNLNGTTGIDFFVGTNGARDLEIDPQILADIRNIAAGASGAPGDGGLANAIAELRDTELAGLGNRSATRFFNDMIAVLGQDSASIAIAFDTQLATMTQLEAQRQSVSGVNVDEELANMMRYQRSFQAAAKILSVLDQTTEELIKTFGR